MSDIALPFFVVTGGPGSGKTTLIEALARAGFTVAPEAGRGVIREQQAHGGRALPSVDPLAFAAAMLARDLASYDAHRDAAGPVFFDRGIPDIVGYLRLEGVAVPADMLRAARAKRYRRPVFVCPPWPDIYVTDGERKQVACDRSRYAERRRSYGLHQIGVCQGTCPRTRLQLRSHSRLVPARLTSARLTTISLLVESKYGTG